MVITYEELLPYLKASQIVLVDREGTPLTEQEAKHRLVKYIEPAKNVRSGILVITVF